MPIAIPAISDPAPRPRIAKRTICCQSIAVSQRVGPKGGAAETAPPLWSTDVGLAPELEGRGRPEERGEPLELAGSLVLEELGLVVAGGRLGGVLPAVQARRAEG